MVKKKFDFTILGFAVILVLVIVLFSSSQNVSESECSLDSECVKVQTTCCPCSAGGEEQCVPASEVSFWEEKLENECTGREFCAQVYNCVIDSCACENGECGAK